MSDSELTTLKQRADLLDSMVKSLQSQLKQVQSNQPNSSEDSRENKNSKSNQKNKRSSRTIDQLGERMKAYEEKAYITKIMNNKEPLIVRLDGHCFHTFTKGFDRPFDTHLHRAMVLTTGDLVDRFQARTGYTQSDEITLIFDAAESEEKDMENDTENIGKKKKKSRHPNDRTRVHLFGGRGVKISSVLSGYCSTRFNYHLTQMSNNGIFDDGNIYKKHVQKRVINGEAHFDGRCFNVPNRVEVLNNIIWRCHFDCTRNSISSLARKYFSQKQMHGKGKKDLIEMMKTEKNVDWNEQPLAFRYGTFVKRELYDLEYVKKGKIEEKGMTKRTRVTAIPIELDKFDEKYIYMLMSKYWTKEWLDLKSNSK
eukprot:77234_1